MSEEAQIIVDYAMVSGITAFGCVLYFLIGLGVVRMQISIIKNSENFVFTILAWPIVCIVCAFMGEDNE